MLKVKWFQIFKALNIDWKNWLQILQYKNEMYIIWQNIRGWVCKSSSLKLSIFGFNHDKLYMRLNFTCQHLKCVLAGAMVAFSFYSWKMATIVWCVELDKKRDRDGSKQWLLLYSVGKNKWKRKLKLKMVIILQVTGRKQIHMDVKLMTQFCRWNWGIAQSFHCNHSSTCNLLTVESNMGRWSLVSGLKQTNKAPRGLCFWHSALASACCSSHRGSAWWLQHKRNWMYYLAEQMENIPWKVIAAQHTL